MASRFYAASGVAYSTPAAFFAPSRREPEQLHPALRQEKSTAGQKSQNDGNSRRAASRRTLSSAKTSTGTKATWLQSEDNAISPSHRRGGSVVDASSRKLKGATEDGPFSTITSTRVHGANSGPRQPPNSPRKARRPGSLARFVGEIRFGCALLRLWSRRQMLRPLEWRGHRDR
ncbi:hypothetical protein LTS16_001790 [Friedmanniomyces endolithicus]|nr:hypothetical protein LTR01_000492 [Friedmanniomyces endolithicus]KAK0834918.1 hypothetical protein LTR73_001210 [Friedmanniomyces endolithicus]KAK0923709.1 hypothetical protein LTR57_006643 [Friedmanniomyces endolithicus]KAK1052721.1 hypothetical protein LTS16_001790 [Friedmanniomyces endolithicus]